MGGCAQCGRRLGQLSLTLPILADAQQRRAAVKQAEPLADGDLEVLATLASLLHRFGGGYLGLGGEPVGESLGALLRASREHPRKHAGLRQSEAARLARVLRCQRRHRATERHAECGVGGRKIDGRRK